MRKLSKNNFTLIPRWVGARYTGQDSLPLTPATKQTEQSDKENS